MIVKKFDRLFVSIYCCLIYLGDSFLQIHIKACLNNPFINYDLNEELSDKSHIMPVLSKRRYKFQMIS